MGKRPRKAEWNPAIHGLAYYNGKGSTLSRTGFLVRVLAETSGKRMYVEALGQRGEPVRFTVKIKNLSQPEPMLFDGIEAADHAP